MQTRQHSKIANPNVVLYSQTDEFPSIEAPCGNSLMLKLSSVLDEQHGAVQEIPADDLKFLDKVGDGLFGSVHVGEMKSMNNDKQHVMIKSLNDNADEKQR